MPDDNGKEWMEPLLPSPSRANSPPRSVKPSTGFFASKYYSVPIAAILALLFLALGAETLHRKTIAALRYDLAVEENDHAATVAQTRKLLGQEIIELRQGLRIIQEEIKVELQKQMNALTVAEERDAELKRSLHLVLDVVRGLGTGADVLVWSDLWSETEHFNSWAFGYTSNQSFHPALPIYSFKLSFGSLYPTRVHGTQDEAYGWWKASGLTKFGGSNISFKFGDSNISFTSGWSNSRYEAEIFYIEGTA
ncbi:hypothetical protein RQP46_002477 [Phenoliferia psychrophenolica]